MSLCFSVCLSTNLTSPLPFIPSQLQGEEVAAYLTWPLNVIHVHWSNSALTVCPHNADQTQQPMALFVSNVTDILPIQQVHQQVRASPTPFKHPFLYMCIHDCPLNNTHTHPYSRATAVPLWMMRLCWDGDKWAFITAMIAPSSTGERDERKRRSPPFIPSVHHLPCPRVLNA